MRPGFTHEAPSKTNSFILISPKRSFYGKVDQLRNCASVHEKSLVQDWPAMIRNATESSKQSALMRLIFSTTASEDQGQIEAQETSRSGLVHLVQFERYTGFSETAVSQRASQFGKPSRS
jgi:hypothetical protein